MSVTKNNFEKPKFYNSHRSRQLSKKESIGHIKTQKSFIKTKNNVGNKIDVTGQQYLQKVNFQAQIKGKEVCN